MPFGQGRFLGCVHSIMESGNGTQKYHSKFLAYWHLPFLTLLPFPKLLCLQVLSQIRTMVREDWCWNFVRLFVREFAGDSCLCFWKGNKHKYPLQLSMFDLEGCGIVFNLQQLYRTKPCCLNFSLITLVWIGQTDNRSKFQKIRWNKCI